MKTSNRKVRAPHTQQIVLAELEKCRRGVVLADVLARYTPGSLKSKADIEDDPGTR